MMRELPRRRRVAALLTSALLLAAGPRGARGEDASPRREPYRDPTLTALRSAVFPGWGQHVNAEHSKGYLFLGIAATGLVLATNAFSLSDTPRGQDFERALGLTLIGISLGVGAYDAHASARRLNRENGYELGRPTPAAGLRLAWRF